MRSPVARATDRLPENLSESHRGRRSRVPADADGRQARQAWFDKIQPGNCLDVVGSRHRDASRRWETGAAATGRAGGKPNVVSNGVLMEALPPLNLGVHLA